MTPLQQVISDNEREFEEKFVASNVGRVYNWKATALTQCTDVRKFLHSSQLRLIEEVKRMCDGKRCTAGWQFAPDRVAGKNAYNKALNDIISTLEEVK